MTTATLNLPVGRIVPVVARPAVPTGETPLSEEHYHQLRLAAIGRQPVLKAARAARASAITILVIGLSGLPVALLFPGWLSFLTTVGITVIGTVEWVGARRLREADPGAATFLGRNQMAFLALIIAYCLYQMLAFSPEQAQTAALAPQLKSQLAQVPSITGDIDKQLAAWAPFVTYSFYTLVIVISIAAQGGLAWYYFTRRRCLLAWQEDTPAWVRRVLVEIER
ncbi:MAG: hypothetical protein JXO22_14665 [Phycisphaerae bacterium]|nr:hypothetical protein [Phycisphaerae bacterium]